MQTFLRILPVQNTDLPQNTISAECIPSSEYYQYRLYTFLRILPVQNADLLNNTTSAEFRPSSEYFQCAVIFLAFLFHYSIYLDLFSVYQDWEHLKQLQYIYLYESLIKEKGSCYLLQELVQPKYFSIQRLNLPHVSSLSSPCLSSQSPMGEVKVMDILPHA